MGTALRTFFVSHHSAIWAVADAAVFYTEEMDPGIPIEGSGKEHARRNDAPTNAGYSDVFCFMME